MCGCTRMIEADAEGARLIKELGRRGVCICIDCSTVTASLIPYPVARLGFAFLALAPLLSQLKTKSNVPDASIDVQPTTTTTVPTFELLISLTGFLSLVGPNVNWRACEHGSLFSWWGEGRVSPFDSCQVVRWYVDLVVASCCSFSHCRACLTRDCGEED